MSYQYLLTVVDHFGLILSELVAHLWILNGLRWCRRLVRHWSSADWDSATIMVGVKILSKLGRRLLRLLSIGELGLSVLPLIFMNHFVNQVKMVLHLLVFHFLDKISPTSSTLFAVVKRRIHGTSCTLTLNKRCGIFPAWQTTTPYFFLFLIRFQWRFGWRRPPFSNFFGRFPFTLLFVGMLILGIHDPCILVICIFLIKSNWPVLSLGSSIVT